MENLVVLCTGIQNAALNICFSTRGLNDLA